MQSAIKKISKEKGYNTKSEGKNHLEGKNHEVASGIRTRVA